MNESHNSRDIQHLPSSRQGTDAREWGGVADTPRLTEGERERESLLVKLKRLLLYYGQLFHRLQVDHISNH